MTTRLGAMLRLYRAARGIDIREAAKTLGVSAATLSRIERGQTFDAATLLRLWSWLLAAEGGPE
jgi:transcriptional regulator with XRE-family HTH domain